MYDSYKSFLISEELFDWLQWVHSVSSDDLDAFLRLYDPSEDTLMFDPIEFAIAYDAGRIFSFLIETYDYSDFYNQVDFSLLILNLMFEREHFLLMSLDAFHFSREQMLEMYEYMILYKDGEYFKQFYENYPLHPSDHKELLRLSLNNYEVFHYLISLESHEALLKDYSIVYDIVSFHPSLLGVIEGTESLDAYKDTDLFMNVLKLETLESFKRSLTFLLERGWHLDETNAYGLTMYHLALRFAADSRYVDVLIEHGADVNKKTSLGYPCAHQLLLRDASFTLELGDYIDFTQKDPHGLTLQDYDALVRKSNVNYFDVLSIVKVVLNMEESDFYELSEDEFYHIAQVQGIDIFMPFVTLLKTESPRIKEAFVHTLGSDSINAHDVRALTDMFPGKFDIDVNKTLQLDLDFWDINESTLEQLRSFALDHTTHLTIESEEEHMNDRGQVVFEIYPSGKVEKRAVVYSHLVDVYYLHFYYEIPLENIMYNPTAKQPQRYLN